MNKRRYLSVFISVFLVLHFLPIIVLAHPGKTDAQGGHYDRSTGEYHYHHGYPAHQHYDMDGDGDIDCPYDFDDQTGISSGSNNKSGYSNGNSRNKGNKVNPPAATVVKPTKPVKIEPDKKEVKTVPIWLAVILILANIILFIENRSLHQELAYRTENFKKKLQENEDSFHTEITDLLNDIANVFGKEVVKVLAGMPNDETIDKDLLPVGTDAGDYRWGSKYTFYTSSSRKYHRHGCRYCNSCYPINAYNINNSKYYIPCLICKPQTPNTDWVERYRKYAALFKKYKIEIPAKAAIPSNTNASSIQPTGTKKLEQISFFDTY